MANLSYLDTIANSLSLNTIDDEIRTKHRNVLQKYYANIEHILVSHPLFSSGWSRHPATRFFGAGRFTSRVIYKFITEQIDKSKKILDFGCFDGVLVKILNDAGYDAYGFELNNFDSIWNKIDIAHKINNYTFRNSDVVIAFNICHNWKPEEFFKIIESENKEKPKLLFIDLEHSRKMHSEEYYKGNFGKKVLFPNFVSADSEAVLHVIE